MRQNHVAVLICLLPAIGGCFRSYHDISNSPDVRATHLVGKSYDVLRDLEIIKFEGDRFETVVPRIEPGTQLSHLGTLPGGSIVKITQVVFEDVPPTHSNQHPIAIVQNGSLAGRKISMIHEFGAVPPAFASYSLIAPHPSRPVSQTRLTAWLADANHSDPAIRYWAVRYLGELTPPVSSEVVAALVRGTSDVDPEVRLGAVAGLRRSSANAAAVVAALINILSRHDHYIVQEAARDSLAAIGPAALPQVAQLLHSKETEVVGRAIVALGAFGPAARPYLPELAALIRDKREQPQGVVSVMRDIDAAASAKLLLPLAGDPHTREDAIVALGELASSFYNQTNLGKELNEILSVLVQGLDDPAENIRRAALGSLGQVGPAAKAALPRLRQMLDSTPKDANWPHIQKFNVEQVIQAIER